ncbi:MAG: pyridoxamine 5'-phosphate oxidase family protein [Flavobacteriales bacterium]|nr:pyridoxamine 5'-phosphate oxidase family protein [Flavobacteriales bacterium]
MDQTMLGTLNNEQIEELLREECIGRIGCRDGDSVYVVPVTYVHVGGSLFCHSAEGRKIRLMRQHPQVCVEVDRMQDMANWQSVIAQGRFVELHGDEARQGMRKLVERLLPLMPSTTAHPGEGGHAHDVSGLHAVAFRIDLAEKSGRFEQR